MAIFSAASEQKISGLDGTMLKLIAMVSMLIDHIGDIFFPDALWMRFLGRIAMPVFAFCISEGCIHTRSRRRYVLRLGIFAVVSEAPFDLAFNGGIDLTHQNIMLTFALAVIAMTLWDAAVSVKDIPSPLRIAGGLSAVLGICIIASLLGADYGFFGVGTVFIFYLMHRRPNWQRVACGVGFVVLLHTHTVHTGTVFSLIPLIFYNRRKGRGLKWLFYAFYPGHLLVLFLIHMFIQTAA